MDEPPLTDASGGRSGSRLPVLAAALLAAVWIHSFFFMTGVSTWQDGSSRGGGVTVFDGRISFGVLSHDGDRGGAYHWGASCNRIVRSGPYARPTPPPLSPRFSRLGFTWYHIPLPGQTVNQGGERYTFSRGRQDSFSVPFWIVLLPSAIFIARRSLRHRTRERRRARGHCVQCGYDLRSNPDRCPECGSARVRRADPGEVTLQE
jgi:hypothetical protein